MKKLHRAEGFTLIELMIVILIIAILVAIAVPIYINATNNAKKRTCQANLRTIDGSVATWHADVEAQTSGVTVPELVTMGYLKRTPYCPKGNTSTGAYELPMSLPSSALNASCVQDGSHTYP